MEVVNKGKAKAKRRHLGAEQCDELGSSAEGSHALTQPQCVDHRQNKREPNQRLLPRTPTKRWKSASEPTSPPGQQRGIKDFFPLSRVISTSPLKSAQPGSSQTHGLLGEPAPKEQQKVEEDEDDDVSLLAVATETEPEVDYLEGITAEMFWDDEFDRCDNDVSPHAEEEEVEAVPDAHFGLLGTSKGLMEPQGCIDDLPEEVLRQVLCLLPAQDLYRNIVRVCHHWMNIVQDVKFVPLKKQYFRYLMKEEATVQEIHAILKSSHIIDSAMSEHCVRHLVVVMAQHQVGERVRPEDVLKCVKKHRLFPQAESCIRLRIPHIQKHLGLGIEAPNPYAAMAVILILSESVCDAQALVSVLTRCMSHIAITEYLSQMAMMLLAMMRNNIEMSNRVHYNVYYVLHLMENGLFPVHSSGGRRLQIQLTHEQQQILSHDIQPNHVVKIIAFAGTGKTTTLVKFAERRPHLRFLYVAFNNSVARAAQSCFPSNVDCKTVHSLAYRDVGERYKILKKLTFNLRPFSLASILPKGRGGFVNGKVVVTTINTFMASSDPRINYTHVPDSFMNTTGRRQVMDFDAKQVYVNDAQKIWDQMKSLKMTTIEGHHMTHDGYLKLWQLQSPQPCLSDRYDVIFIDEAQDCTPAIMDVLLSQRCGKVLVGDPHQQIYTFRGAVNALHIVPHTHIYYLTQSFRFGPEIAYVGATLLKVCKKVTKILVGGNQNGGVCDDTAEKVSEMVKTGRSEARGRIAILCRCNLSVFNEAIQLIDINPCCRIHFIGEYFLKPELMDSLMKPDTPLPCSVHACPNCIRSCSSFIMCKRRMTLTDCVSGGGPLCEKCVWKSIGPTAFLLTDEVSSMAEIPVRLNLQNANAMLLALL
ncbi:F-box DNA helicase 1 isoform X2 [Genypterus blacodes]|uniref:F-box DNA helicase 1 isoform X2 n=1 Tax=Genypterus blacodes TaxID=154954 RepID=UPI003F7733C8